jgi:hypothetical protein
MQYNDLRWRLRLQLAYSFRLVKIVSRFLNLDLSNISELFKSIVKEVILTLERIEIRRLLCRVVTLAVQLSLQHILFRK